MEKLTTENLGRRMATVLDDKVETAPYIQGEISTSGQITLGSGRSPQEMFEEANEIALVLKAGALPAPVTISEERTVGATLGPELVEAARSRPSSASSSCSSSWSSTTARAGLIADVALVLNGLLVLAIMAMIGSTLTLPGIAGFVLTLGMAVDANVLINERIREELRAGKTVKQAVQQGYDRVFWTIFDSHVTTLVAALVLMQYGSGPVRGFAVTLIIGLVASMFTSIVVTRVDHGVLHAPRHGAAERVAMQFKSFDIVPHGTKFDFVGKRRIAVVLSLVVERRPSSSGRPRHPRPQLRRRLRRRHRDGGEVRAARRSRRDPQGRRGARLQGRLRPDLRRRRRSTPSSSASSASPS